MAEGQEAQGAGGGPAADSHALALLEFRTIVEELASLALSAEGAALLREQHVSADPDQVERLKALAGELKGILAARPLPALHFPPVSAILPKLDKEGAVCEGGELYALGSYCRSAALFLHYLTTPAEGESAPPAGLLRLEAQALPALHAQASRILDLIDEEGRIIEEKVPELKAIRRRIQRLHSEIGEITARYMAGDRELWQSDVATQRDGRTVLPLKANFKGRIAGIVHEVSSTGATLFIEPLEIVERNNALVEQDNEYLRIVHRILRELTELLQEHAGEIGQLVRGITFLDTITARARYSALHDCRRAEPAEGGLVLREARHPLLGAKAVPIGIELEGSTRIMVITGPNAGGKTVALKCVGLLALMNQWGMEIPAGEGSRLPIYDRILVDIGDDQSITDSLSTFSGHMRSVSRILAASSGRSLVLLDEIGSGTDPAEGSAIAMAVLDRLLERGSTVVATTHHGALKGYAFSHPGVMNASVSFDAETLSPTYAIVQGVPGESHALDVAARSAIPGEVLATARAYRDRARSALDHAAEEMAARARELAARQEESALRERAVAAREARLGEREALLAQREEETRSRELGELARYVEESRRELENLVRELRNGELDREKTRRVKTFIEKLESKAADEKRELARRRPKASEKPLTIEPGQEVLAGKNRRRGTVVRRARDGRWVVAVNTLRITVDASELAPARAGRGTASGPPALSIAVSDVRAQNPPAMELDLRGMRLEEALDALARQLDRAVLAGISEFSVIHGKGEGILQAGVRDYLRQSGLVSEFHFSPPEAGGFGKTVVLLGQKEQGSTP